MIGWFFLGLVTLYGFMSVLVLVNRLLNNPFKESENK